MLNDNVFYTINAICRSYQLNQNAVGEMVACGIAEPFGNKPERWLFSHKDYERIGRASKFNKELEVNIRVAALAIQLLDDIQDLRKRRVINDSL